MQLSGLTRLGLAGALGALSVIPGATARADNQSWYAPASATPTPNPWYATPSATPTPNPWYAQPAATQAPSQPTPAPTAPAQPAPASPDSDGSGGFRVGDPVLTHGGGSVFEAGVIVGVEPGTQSYQVKDHLGYWTQTYYYTDVYRPTRDSGWTDFAIGAWQVRIPGADNTLVSTDGRSVIDQVTGGAAEAALQIAPDGSYTWTLDDGSDITGTWTPRPDALGIILQGGLGGSYWTVWNNTSRDGIDTRHVEQLEIASDGVEVNREAIRPADA